MSDHIIVEQLAKVDFNERYAVIIPDGFILKLAHVRGVNARWKNVAAFLEMALEAWITDEWNENKWKDFKGDFQDAVIVPDEPKYIEAPPDGAGDGLITESAWKSLFK